MELFSNWVVVVAIIKVLFVLENQYTLVLDPLIDFFCRFASSIVPAGITRLKEYSYIGLVLSAVVPLKLYLFVITVESGQFQTFERDSELVCNFVEFIVYIIERIF